MDNFPEVKTCCGVVPPKHASFLISVIGLGVGGFIIAGVVMFALIEHSTVMNFTNKIDPGVKKIVILTVGVTGLLLTVGNLLLFFGVASKSHGKICAYVIMMLVMILIIIMAIAGPPVNCFIAPESCPLKGVSIQFMFIACLFLTGFLSTFLYFAVVAGNYGATLG